MADDNKPKRKLIVRELRKIHTGRTKAGAEYVVWQVVATTPDGRPIDVNLRTFEELPRNEVIECTVELFKSEQYGDSYTLKQLGRRSTKDELKALEARVAKLEQTIYMRDDPYTNQGGHAAPPQPTTQAQPPPPAPPPPPPATPAAAPPLERPLPGDEDIPF